MAAAAKLTVWDALPLYATDSEIGEALLGKGDAWKWGQIMVPALEKRGLPRLNPYSGRRYRPAVRSFLDRQEGLTPAVAGEQRRWEENFDDEGSAAKRARRA